MGRLCDRESLSLQPRLEMTSLGWLSGGRGAVLSSFALPTGTAPLSHPTLPVWTIPGLTAAA